MSSSHSTADLSSPPSAPSVQVQQTNNSAPHHVKEENDTTNENQHLNGKAEKSINQSSVVSSGSSQPSNLKQDIIMKNLMKLESSQTCFSKYPPGCMVHYNFNSPPESQTISAWNTKIISSFSVGKVKTVYMDFGSKNLVYEVSPLRRFSCIDNSTLEMVTEEQLAYATGAAIYLDFEEGKPLIEGEVMGYNHIENMYTVLVFGERNEIQMHGNVNPEVIKHRCLNLERGSNKKRKIEPGTKEDKTTQPVTSDPVNTTVTTPQKRSPSEGGSTKKKRKKRQRKSNSNATAK